MGLSHRDPDMELVQRGGGWSGRYFMISSICAFEIQIKFYENVMLIFLHQKSR